MTDLRSVQTGLALVATLGGALLVVSWVALWLLSAEVRRLSRQVAIHNRTINENVDIDAGNLAKVQARFKALEASLEETDKVADENVDETTNRLDDHNVRLVALADRANVLDAKLAEHTATELRNLDIDRSHHAKAEAGLDAVLALQAGLESRVETVEKVLEVTWDRQGNLHADVAAIRASVDRALTLTVDGATTTMDDLASMNVRLDEFEGRVCGLEANVDPDEPEPSELAARLEAMEAKLGPIRRCLVGLGAGLSIQIATEMEAPR